MSDVDLAAREGLQKLGYTQEMTRSRGLFHMTSMILAILVVPLGLAWAMTVSLITGGSVVMIWGLVLVSVLTQALALSLAEICSKYPTSAGAYYWCYRLAPPRYRLLFSWTNGWLNLIGNWTFALASVYGTTQFLVAGVGIYYPLWVPTPWQMYLIFLGFTAAMCGICLFCNKYLPIIDIACTCWTGLGLIVILVCLFVKANAGYRSAEYALGNFEPISGWSSGWSFVVGLYAVTCYVPSSFSKVFSSFDPLASLYIPIGMVVSMAEEVHSPSDILPRALSLSVPIGTVWGVLYTIPILFTLPDIGRILQSGSSQPICVILPIVMGSKGGGFGLWFILFGMAVFAIISISCAASRTTWVFARDKAIPLHSYFSKISTTFPDVPANALLLSTAIQMILGLISFSSSAAFNAIFGVCLVCFSVVYVMPIAASLAQGRADMADAPFYLGSVGVIINIITVLWCLLSLILFSVPVSVPVTVLSMNYSSVAFAGFAVIGVVYYLIHGRYYYLGPPVPLSKSDASLMAESASKGE